MMHMPSPKSDLSGHLAKATLFSLCPDSKYPD